MDNITWINAVAGKPWVDRAYGPNAFDCWGLVIDSFRRIDDVELQEATGYNEGLPIEEIGTETATLYGWPEIEKPADGCVFCIYLSNGAMVHVGRILSIYKAGLHAVHAAGKDGKGQVAAEAVRSITDKYKDRIKYYMRPTDASN
jgi:hypothetical protein